MTSSPTRARTETHETPETPVTTMAWGSVAVVVGAVLAGLVVSSAVVATGLGRDDRGLSVDSVASLVVTGLGLGAGSYVLGTRLGVPTLLHLLVGSLGAVVLGLATFTTGPGVVLASVVLVAYVVLAVVGLSRGAASRRGHRVQTPS